MKKLTVEVKRVLKAKPEHVQKRVKNPVKYVDGPTIEDDPTNPSYYTRGKVEVIDLVETLPFNRGNAIKYIYRAGFKDPGNPEKELGDLEKAAWYLSREIQRLKETL